MFILYYQDDDYYYAKPEFLLCSPHKEDLEHEKENLVKISEEVRKEIKRYNKEKWDHERKHWGDLADWLEENREAIQPFITFEMIGSNAVKHIFYGKNDMILDSRDIALFPKEAINQQRDSFIKKVRDEGRATLLQITDHIYEGKTKSPMPIQEKFNKEYPRGRIYDADHLFIEEVKEVQT